MSFNYPNFPTHDKALEDREVAPYRPFRWGKYKCVSLQRHPFKALSYECDVASPWALEAWDGMIGSRFALAAAQPCDNAKSDKG